MAHRFAFACLLALTLISRPLFADPTVTELAVARKLFEEAVRLEGDKRWKEARGKLQEALAIKETPGLRFHLGYCAEQLGELVAAQIEYERALDLIRGGAKAPDVARLVEPARARVQARVAQLTLRLPADAEGADVSLDGQKLAPAVIGRPAPIDPGRHQIRVTASQNRVAQVDFDLREGEQRTVHIVLKPAQTEDKASAPTPAPALAAPPTATPQPAPQPEAASASTSLSAPATMDDAGIGTRELVLIGEGSLALVGLGVGIGYLIVRSGAQNRIDAAQQEIDMLVAGGDSSTACSNPNFTGQAACADLATAIDDHDRAGTIATIGFVGAGVAGAATVLTFLLWKPEQRPAVSLGVGPGGSGIALSGAF